MWCWSRGFSAWAFQYKWVNGEGLAISPWSENTMSMSLDYFYKGSGIGKLSDLGEKLFHIHTHPGGAEGFGYGAPSRIFNDAGKMIGGDQQFLKGHAGLPHYILSKHEGVTRYYSLLSNKSYHTTSALDDYFNVIMIFGK